MPSEEELEQLLERDISEFPDDDAWASLKAEILAQRDKEEDDG